MASYTRHQCEDEWNRFGKLAILVVGSVWTLAVRLFSPVQQYQTWDLGLVHGLNRLHDACFSFTYLKWRTDSHGLEVIWWYVVIWSKLLGYLHGLEVSYLVICSDLRYSGRPDMNGSCSHFSVVLYVTLRVAPE